MFNLRKCPSGIEIGLHLAVLVACGPKEALLVLIGQFEDLA